MSPRANKNKSRTTSRNVAARLRHERTSREWTYAALKSQMAAAGCDIAVSSLNKIERDDPPRNVTVDELFAFARVFDLGVEEMATAPSDDESLVIAKEISTYVQAVDEVVAGRRRALEVQASLAAHAEGATRATIDESVECWHRDQWEEYPERTRTGLKAFLSGITTSSPFDQEISGQATRIRGRENLIEREDDPA